MVSGEILTVPLNLEGTNVSYTWPIKRKVKVWGQSQAVTIAVIAGEREIPSSLRGPRLVAVILELPAEKGANTEANQDKREGLLTDTHRDRLHAMRQLDPGLP